MGMKSIIAAVAFLATAGTALPALAQDQKVCLQNNRVWSWDVLNNRTLVVEDRDRNKFAVSLSGGCVGLDDARLTLAFRTSSRLGCMERGDRVLYRAQGLGRMSCLITDVQPLRTGTRDEEYDEK